MTDLEFISQHGYDTIESLHTTPQAPVAKLLLQLLSHREAVRRCYGRDMDDPDFITGWPDDVSKILEERAEAQHVNIARCCGCGKMCEDPTQMRYTVENLPFHPVCWEERHKPGEKWEADHQQEQLKARGLDQEFPWGCDAIGHLADAYIAKRDRLSRLEAIVRYVEEKERERQAPMPPGIEAIKEVRDMTGLGLKEAKESLETVSNDPFAAALDTLFDFVNAGWTPSSLQHREELEAAVKSLEAQLAAIRANPDCSEDHKDLENLVASAVAYVADPYNGASRADFQIRLASRLGKHLDEVRLFPGFSISERLASVSPHIEAIRDAVRPFLSAHDHTQVVVEMGKLRKLLNAK